jgi:hypothetical protein
MSKLNLSKDYAGTCEMKSSDQPENILAKNKNIASITSIINYTYTSATVYSEWLIFLQW